MNVTQSKAAIRRLLRPRGEDSFLAGLESDSAILDVGGGGNLRYMIESTLPQCRFTGIDDDGSRQTRPNPADIRITAAPETLADEIAKFEQCFDAVISAHNIEHSLDRDKTFHAMLGAVRPGGKIYLSFPCEQSAAFPHREGTLNYFDDSAHLFQPPVFDDMVNGLKANNFQIEFAARRYRPPLLALLGLMQEPSSRAQKRVLRGTWAYYGFESIIWARKTT